MLFDLNRHSCASWRAEARAIMVLALPMLVAQVAQVGTGFVDTVMAGRYGVGDLAAVALGSSIFTTVYVTLISFPTALNPLLSHLVGAGKIEEANHTARQGIWLCAAVGVAAMVLLWLMIPPLQAYLSLDAEVKRKTGWFLAAVATALPAALIQKAFYAYAASFNRTSALMWVSLAALAVNVVLNSVLVYGRFGLPELGGVGCGVATSLVFWFGTLVLWGYFHFSPYFRPLGLMRRREAPQWRAFKPVLQLALPITLSFFLEVSLFSFIALLVERFGLVYVGSQQVVINLTAMLYMLPQTVGAALSVRVGQALGSGLRRQARYISGVGLSLGLAGALGSALFLVLFRQPLLGLYTESADIIALGSRLLLIAALFQVFDATQTIASSALRGYTRTRLPMVIHATCFWGLGLGLGAFLAFYCGWKIFGFWAALVLALAVAATALTVYLARVSKAP